MSAENPQVVYITNEQSSMSDFFATMFARLGGITVINIEKAIALASQGELNYQVVMFGTDTEVENNMAFAQIVDLLRPSGFVEAFFQLTRPGGLPEGVEAIDPLHFDNPVGFYRRVKEIIQGTEDKK